MMCLAQSKYYHRKWTLVNAARPLRLDFVKYLRFASCVYTKHANAHISSTPRNQNVFSPSTSLRPYNQRDVYLGCVHFISTIYIVVSASGLEVVRTVALGSVDISVAFNTIHLTYVTFPINVCVCVCLCLGLGRIMFAAFIPHIVIFVSHLNGYRSKSISNSGQVDIVLYPHIHMYMC